MVMSPLPVAFSTSVCGSRSGTFGGADEDGFGGGAELLGAAAGRGAAAGGERHRQHGEGG